MNNKLRLLFKTIRKVIKGQEDNVKLLLSSFLARGHVLLEGIPGTGKTTLSLAFARLLGIEFKRIQGTSDMLPADITGAFVPDNRGMKFLKGPVFTDVLLVDEINRMNPRTQSALLEAMEERQVTVEGRTYKLSPLFFVIATQNPLDSYGTFPLPVSQLDRFMLKVQINRVSESIEREIVREGYLRERVENLESIFTKEELLKMIDNVKDVSIDSEIENYVFDFVRDLRRHPLFSNTLSTRSILHVMSVAKAFAFIEGRNYVIPDDVKTIMGPVVLHRIGLDMSYADKEKILDEIKKSLEPPI